MQLSNVCGFFYMYIWAIYHELPVLKFRIGTFRKGSALLLHIVKCEFCIANPRYVRQKNVSKKMCNTQNNSVSQYAAVWISNH